MRARELIEAYKLNPNKVLQAAAAAPDRKGSLAYIYSTYNQLKKLFPMEYVAIRNLDHFKSLLLDMHMKRAIRLAEADMPQTLDKMKLRLSRIPYRSSSYVFIRVPGGHNEL